MNLKEIKICWTTITDECPYCKKEIILPAERWNTESVCPLCEKKIEVEYDFYLLDDYEEADFWIFKKAE